MLLRSESLGNNKVGIMKLTWIYSQELRRQGFNEQLGRFAQCFETLFLYLLSINLQWIDYNSTGKGDTRQTS